MVRRAPPALAGALCDGADGGVPIVASVTDTPALTADLPPTPFPSPAPGTPARRGPLLDAGWLFLLAGSLLLAVVMILPAQADLDDARLYLARVQALEAHRGERLGQYQQYLSAVQQGAEPVVRSLAATQLNQAPAGEQLLVPDAQAPGAPREASVFAALEPAPLVLPERTVEASVLQRWAGDPRGRLVLMAAGAMCLLVGLLPPTRPRA